MSRQMKTRALTAQARRGISTRGLTPTGVRTSAMRKLEHRSVKDVTYYKSLLFQRITELRIELRSLKKECDQLTKAQATFSAQFKRAKDLAEDLTVKQALLNDVNAALDSLNVGSDVPAIQKLTAALKESNDRITEEHEILYADRLDKKTAISRMSAEVCKLRQRGETLTRSDYDAIRTDPKKRELAQLELRLWNLENQRNCLQFESESRFEDPEDELRMILDKLALGVEDKLSKITKRLDNFPKLEQYEKFSSKDISDFAKADTPQRLLMDLECYLQQLSMVHRTLEGAVRKFRDKTIDLKEISPTQLNLAQLETASNRKRAALANQKTNLECRRHSSQMTVDTMRTELDNCKRQLMKTKDYSDVCSLELQLRELCRQNHGVKEFLEEGAALKDLPECRERALSAVYRLNEKLISSLGH